MEVDDSTVAVVLTGGLAGTSEIRARNKMQLFHYHSPSSLVLAISSSL